MGHMGEMKTLLTEEMVMERAGRTRKPQLSLFLPITLTNHMAELEQLSALPSIARPLTELTNPSVGRIVSNDLTGTSKYSFRSI